MEKKVLRKKGGEGEQKKLIRTSERESGEKMASSFEDFVSIFILCFVFVGLVRIFVCRGFFICFSFLCSLETWFLRKSIFFIVIPGR